VTADLISLRHAPRPVPVLRPVPRRTGPSRPVPSRPRVPVPAGPVVEWDTFRGLHAAVCGRCCESLDALTVEQAHQWAENHRCDPELAALLAEVLNRRVA
jgi:hypothetical protein